MTEGMRFTTPRHEQVYVAYGTVYDCVDALAAILFIVGSVLFFGTATQTAGTWAFLTGSVCFAVRPVVRDMRRLPKDWPRPLARAASPCLNGPYTVFTWCFILPGGALIHHFRRV